MFLRVIVSDGSSREEVVLKGEAAFPNRRIGTLKYCVINIKDTDFRNGGM